MTDQMPTSTVSSKKQENSRKKKKKKKHIYFCFIDQAKAFDCGSLQTVENSSRGGNTRPTDLPPEKFACRSRNNS